MEELRRYRLGDLLDMLDQIPDGCVMVEFEGNDNGEPVKLACIVTKESVYIDMVKNRMERDAHERLRAQRKAERKARRVQREPMSDDSHGG